MKAPNRILAMEESVKAQSIRVTVGSYKGAIGRIKKDYRGSRYWKMVEITWEGRMRQLVLSLDEFEACEKGRRYVDLSEKIRKVTSNHRKLMKTLQELEEAEQGDK